MESVVICSKHAPYIANQISSTGKRKSPGPTVNEKIIFQLCVYLMHGVYVQGYVWKSEVNVSYFFLLFFTLIVETKSLTKFGCQ